MARYFKERAKSGIFPPKTVFHAVSETPHENYNAKFPSATVEMNDAEEIPLIDNEWDEVDTRSQIRKAMSHEDWETSDRAIQQQRDTPQMFMRKPAEIVGLYADPSMKHTVGTLLGLALNQGGPGIVASGDLSKYSSPIVQRGMDAGLVRGHSANPDAEVTNRISLGQRWSHVDLDSQMPLPAYYGTEVSPVSSSEVDVGRRFIHQALRGEKRQRALSPQFEALQRFESERDGGAPYNPDRDPNAVKIPGMED